MSLHAYYAYNLRERQKPVFDVIELDPYLVEEGEAAEQSIRRFFEAGERAFISSAEAK
jgi:hypothetical protein